MRIRRILLVFALLVGLAILLAACGGGGNGGY
jgi:predicted small secreted protein